MGNHIPADAMVFFGATGDLAHKKTFAALQSLVRRGVLNVPIVGVAKSGMTLEQFDALGRMRTAKELKPGDAKATTQDGTEINGFAGLRDYLAGPRREDLLRSISQKLVGYSLGRSIQLSDRKLIDDVTKSMASGGRWSDALLVIVSSEQFRCIRTAEAESTK